MTREQTTIRLPAELKRELQREADEKGISFNAYVLILIDKARQAKQK
nr:MAG TPA: antitoxin [Caudoviricetes sp.]